MPNQYVNSFVILIEQRFGQTAEKLLNELATQNMTYNEAADFVGFKVGTIRKYCHRYKIKLKPSVDPRDEPQTISPDFYNKQINKHNALSRKWSLS
jgi:hypothetical protein